MVGESNRLVVRWGECAPLTVPEVQHQSQRVISGGIPTMTLTLFSYLQAALRRFHDDRAQDAFEYLLVIGGVTVAIILAIATPVGTTLINAVLQGVCGAIDGIPEIADSLDCSTL